MYHASKHSLQTLQFRILKTIESRYFSSSTKSTTASDSMHMHPANTSPCSARSGNHSHLDAGPNPSISDIEDPASRKLRLTFDSTQNPDPLALNKKTQRTGPCPILWLRRLSDAANVHDIEDPTCFENSVQIVPIAWILDLNSRCCKPSQRPTILQPSSYNRKACRPCFRGLLIQSIHGFSGKCMFLLYMFERPQRQLKREILG